MNVPNGYAPIGQNYCYAKLRMGASLMNSEGEEVYFQPGDECNAFIGLVGEILKCALVDDAADMLLFDYFGYRKILSDEFY